MWIHKNKQQCLSVPVPICIYWTPLADQVKVLDPPESLMAIHHPVPLLKRVRFSLPCNHIDRNSTTYCWRCLLLNNRTQIHPTFLANLQQNTICVPTPLTTTLREGVLNGTIPSAISNTNATLHALLSLAPSIPIGIPSKVDSISPMGPWQQLQLSTNSFTMYGSPPKVQTLFPPLPTILSSAPASLLTPDTPSSMTTKRSTITRRPSTRLSCQRMQCYGFGDAHMTNCGMSHLSPMFGT
jgi:hypothetical protein